MPSRGPRRAALYARARLSGIASGFARGISPELAAQASALAAVPGRGRVIADGPIAAATLAGLARRRPVIYNAHNLESGFRGDFSFVSARQARALRRFERRLLARAERVLDGQRARPRHGAPRVVAGGAAAIRAPNVVDVAAIAPVTAPLDARRALFVANFAYEPNRSGMRFLLEEVLPLVWESLPDARLALAGGGLERPASSDPRVETLGFVEDLAAVYAGASCALVPLLQGGGTPLKLDRRRSPTSCR